MSTTGVAVSSFDMFHVGHLSALRQASEDVDRLILVVADDELVTARRGSGPMVAAAERIEVIEAFFPAAAIHLASSDAGEEVVATHHADVVFVCVPDGVTAPAAIGGAEVRPLRYEMTTSPSLLAALEPEILWVPA